MSPICRRPASAVLALVAVLLLVVTACSQTGLSGTVTTTAADSGSTPTTTPGATTPPVTTPPDSSGGGSGGDGPGGGSGGSGPSSKPAGFVIFQNAATPSSLWVIGVDGSKKEQLPAVAGQTVGLPQVSPGGDRVAFLATPPAPPGSTTPPGPPKLWLAGIDGKDPHPITADTVADTCYSWTPDGTHILSASTDAAKTVARLIPTGQAPPTTSSSTTAPAPSTTPASPTTVALDLPAAACPVYVDQNTVAYLGTAPPLAGAAAPRVDRIVTARPDGQPSTLAASTAIDGCTLSDLRANGVSGIVSVAAVCDDAARSGIYLVIEAKDKPATPTLILPGATGPVGWSPDGGWLAYTRSDLKDLTTSEILITRYDGTQPKRLVGPTTSAPTWGPAAGGGAGSVL